ncbi:MAG: polysaccharide biosynthesis protein, partial [Pseudomonadota bacterium]
DQRGHVHVLDMGEPIRIMDLARKMIMLSGLQPGVDIEVRMTGLRPGEKLYEELFTVDEEQISTSYKSVLIGAPLNPRDLQDVFSQVDRLATAIEKRDLETAHAIIRETVPEARLGVLGQTDPAADARRQGSQPSTQQPAPAAIGNVVPLTLATARDR